MSTPRRDRVALWGRLRVPASAAVLAAVLTVTLSLAFAQKLECRWGDGDGTLLRTAWCYSDLVDLWDERGFDVDALPYGPLPVVTDGVPEGQPPRLYEPRYTFEYPPLMGFGAYAAALLTDSERGFYVVNAAALAICAVLTVWLLDRALQEVSADPGAWRRSRVRLLGFVASPTLLTLGFQNWDLWSTAPAAAGLLMAVRRRPVVAAAWFGVAAGVKWWPALLVVPLLAGPWADDERGWTRRLAPVGSFLLTWGLIQLPAMAISVDRWWDSIEFHLDRDPNRASLIGVIGNVGRAVSDSPFWYGPYARLTTVLTFVLLVAAVAVVLRRLEQRRLHPGTAAFVLVAVFLVVSKVVSVQFVIWLLPVAVLADVRWRRVLVVDVLNAAVWLLWAPSGDDGSALFWTSLGVAALRTLVLAAVAADALFRPPRAPDVGAEDRLQTVGAS